MQVFVYELRRMPLPRTPVNKDRSMCLTPPGGIMRGVDPVEKDVSWQGEELLCRQNRTWHWLGVSWRHESRGTWTPWRRCCPPTSLATPNCFPKKSKAAKA